MAEIVRYVNPDSVGGDGTTPALSGANAAYASLSAWNTAEATDLVTAGDTHLVNCAGSTNDSGAFTMSGWTTGSTNYVTIRGNRTVATYDETSYVFEITGAGSGITVSEDYVRFEDVQFRSAHTSGTRQLILLAGHSVTCDIRFTGCIFQATDATQAADGIKHNVANLSAVRIENCLFFDFDTSGSFGVNSGNGYAGGGDVYIEHCTLVNCETGILIRDQTRCINVGFDSQGLAGADGFDTTGGGGSASSVNCFSDLSTDATSLSGSGHGDSTDPTYINESSDDFSLASGDAAWKDAGGTAVNVTDDIVGTTRTGTFDVGFFEVVAASGSMQLVGGSGLFGNEGLVG